NLGMAESKSTCFAFLFNGHSEKIETFSSFPTNKLASASEYAIAAARAWIRLAVRQVPMCSGPLTPCVGKPCLTHAPGANTAATIDRFCSSLQRRRRSEPDITSTRLIAPSFAPVPDEPDQFSARKADPIGPYRTVTEILSFDAAISPRIYRARCPSWSANC